MLGLGKGGIIWTKSVKCKGVAQTSRTEEVKLYARMTEEAFRKRYEKAGRISQVLLTLSLQPCPGMRRPLCPPLLG